MSLEVKNLVIKRGIRTAIDGLSLTLKAGHLYLLEAPNGWGKSSLLDVIAALGIILNMETNADLLAINDLQISGVASAMGVKIIEMLGMLRIAKDRGMLKQTKPLLDELRKVGAYISDSLYTRMLKDVREI